MSTDEILDELNTKILNQEKDKKFIKKFEHNFDKVKYLRFVKKYTQKEVAKLVGISVRQVQRLEKKIEDVV